MGTVDTSRIAYPARVHATGVFADVATYEASALADGEVIQAVNVAPGVTVVDAYLVFDALGASTTLAVGDGDDTDRYIVATASSSAGSVRMTKFPHTYSADDTIDIVLAGGAATGTITLIVFLTSDAPVDLT